MNCKGEPRWVAPPVPTLVVPMHRRENIGYPTSTMSTVLETIDRVTRVECGLTSHSMSPPLNLTSLSPSCHPFLSLQGLRLFLSTSPVPTNSPSASITLGHDPLPHVPNDHFLPYSLTPFYFSFALLPSPYCSWDASAIRIVIAGVDGLGEEVLTVIAEEAPVKVYVGGRGGRQWGSLVQLAAKQRR